MLANAIQMYRWRDPNWPPHIPSLAVYFLEDAQVNAEVTAETGIQTYDNVTIVVVAPAGGRDKSNIHYEVERKLPDGTVKTNREIAIKYGEQLRLYRAGTEAEATGTPLKDLISMTPQTIMNLKARGVHTIEMLAELPDSAGSEMMGFWDFRERAKKHIQLREKNAPMLRMEAIEEKHKAETAELKRQIEELTLLVSKRGPGRPRKEEQQEEAA